MDSKKHLASLLEDHSLEAAPEPVPNYRSQAWAWSSDGGSTSATPSHSHLDHDAGISPDQPALSCVSRETGHEDCARHRFIVWAAVKRNSSVRMPPQDRLKCPLVHCSQLFADHESMLKHLANCRHLASGEYWCYDHSRVERFDDVKCRRCLGHPSKRKKILHLAKNFFHSLGHKSKKSSGASFDADNHSILPPPPSYESLNIGFDVQASELSSNEIVEIDSIEIPAFPQHPPLPGPADVINPQMLTMPPVPPLPELDSTMLSNDAFTQWQTFPEARPPSTMVYPPQEESAVAVRASPVRPTLQLATAGLQGGRRPVTRPVPKPAAPNPARPNKGLSPSSSVRSTASTETNTSMASNGSSMISPASNWSGHWSMGSGFDTAMTSPVDGVAADEMLADAINNFNNEPCPDYLHEFFSELPADMPMLYNPPDVSSLEPAMKFGTSTNVPVNMAFVPEVPIATGSNAVNHKDSTQAAEREEPELEQTDNVCCSETKALVSAAFDALQEHIVTSMVKIKDQKDSDALAQDISNMSIRTVANKGLQTLRSLIRGQAPWSAQEAVCMIHLIYAFSLVLHEQGASHRARSLFLQALDYIRGLPPGEMEQYRRLVISIWQPPDLNLADVDRHLQLLNQFHQQAAQDPKGKAREIVTADLGVRDDALLTVARDFLDMLEISLLNQASLPLEVQVSDLHMAHLKEAINLAGSSANSALLATTRDVLTRLAQGFGDAGLNDRLRDIYQRLGNGSICSVRRIEMELLQAGRGCLPSARFFDEFVPKTRMLCDHIYKKHDVGVSRRNDYHNLGITLIQNLMHEFDNSGGKQAAVPLDDLDAFFNDLSSESGNPFGEISTAQQGSTTTALRGLQLQTPAATTSGSPSSAGVVSPPAEHQQPPPPPPSQQQRQQKAPFDNNKTTGEPEKAPTTTATTGSQKVEADACCDICGYRPKGDPQWFKGSMAKHKKLQHSTQPPKIYKCPYPGCTSQYKNRPDNLRQHQIEKNHWVPGEEGQSSRRPSKRKKVAEED